MVTRQIRQCGVAHETHELTNVMLLTSTRCGCQIRVDVVHRSADYLDRPAYNGAAPYGDSTYDPQPASGPDSPYRGGAPYSPVAPPSGSDVKYAEAPYRDDRGPYDEWRPEERYNGGVGGVGGPPGGVGGPPAGYPGQDSPRGYKPAPQPRDAYPAGAYDRDQPAGGSYRDDPRGYDPADTTDTPDYDAGAPQRQYETPVVTTPVFQPMGKCVCSYAGSSF